MLTRSRLAASLFVFLVTVGATVSNITLEGVTLGENTSQIRDALGDPVQFVSQGDRQLWRYLERGEAVYLDILVMDNAATSVTVIARFKNSPYTDENKISFGASAADVKSQLGEPTRVSTNSDDGSVDLWYASADGVRIYEFYGDRLGFIQLLPPKNAKFSAGESALPADGTSQASAIRIRPSNPSFNSTWIDTYLAVNFCGNRGHWKELSLKLQPDATGNDPLAYTIVHARCTDGSSERDFYFDTAGTVKKGSPQPSPSPSPT